MQAADRVNARQILSIVLQGGLKNVVDLGPPPCLDSFQYRFTQTPGPARRRAWLKLQECERRLVVATWAMAGTDPVTGRNHVLAEDALTALFQSIEATLQVLKEEVDWKAMGTKFDVWLGRLSSYSLSLRALRTIRHFAVHIDELRASSSLSIPLCVESETPFVARAWLLPELDVARLSALTSPKLTSAEIPLWNQVRRSQPADQILEAVIMDLRSIIEEGEKLPP